MRTVLVLILSLSLFACSHSRPPAAPTAPPRNEAVHYATAKVSPDAACVPLSTGASGKADTALCDFGRVLAYCTSGIGIDGQCAALADFRPKAPEQPKAESTPAPSSAPSSPPAPADKPKPEPPKPGAKK